MALVLEPIIEGDEAGETLLFVQGWPDDASLWDPQVAHANPRRGPRCGDQGTPPHWPRMASRRASWTPARAASSRTWRAP